jgi:serine/threonine protein phosphatase PrpC
VRSAATAGAAAAALVDAALAADTHDNVTALVLRLDQLAGA